MMVADVHRSQSPANDTAKRYDTGELPHYTRSFSSMQKTDSTQRGKKTRSCLISPQRTGDPGGFEPRNAARAAARRVAGQRPSKIDRLAVKSVAKYPFYLLVLRKSKADHHGTVVGRVIDQLRQLLLELWA
jgi:hypothetical protein